MRSVERWRARFPGNSWRTRSRRTCAEPRFTGALKRAPQVIAALDQRVESFGHLQSRYESAAGRLSDLLTLVAEPARDPQEDSVAILHVGDVHSNPIGIEITSELARRFQVEAVVDTG